jgi:DNA-binding MarR family transcriptional regulator
MRGAATVRGNPDRGGLCPRDRWLAAVRRVKDRDLPPNAFRVAAELAAHSDAGLTRPCFPGERTIAEAVGLDVRTVQRMVACLEERGFLSVDRVRFKANRYRLGFPANGGANPATASV